MMTLKRAKLTSKIAKIGGSALIGIGRTLISYSKDNTDNATVRTKNTLITGENKRDDSFDFCTLQNMCDEYNLDIDINQDLSNQDDGLAVPFYVIAYREARLLDIPIKNKNIDNPINNLYPKGFLFEFLVQKGYLLAPEKYDWNTEYAKQMILLIHKKSMLNNFIKEIDSYDALISGFGKKRKEKMKQVVIDVATSLVFAQSEDEAISSYRKIMKKYIDDSRKDSGLEEKSIDELEFFSESFARNFYKELNQPL